jgi:sporulation protein YlmC with PRC-barrel domain
MNGTPSTTRNRLDEPFEAVLHLLDRQLLDIEGQMLGKVDDVELTEDGDDLVVTAVLVGTTALLHRLGGRLGGWLVAAHARLRPAQPDRTRPWRIPIVRVARVDSAVHLAVDRKGVLEHGRDGLRLGTLTGMDVLAGGETIGSVIDVRCRPDGDRLVVTDLVVGRGGVGSLLGYDRHEEQGPWLVGAVVRWIHRNNRAVPHADVEIDWDRRRVTVAGRHPLP